MLQMISPTKPNQAILPTIEVLIVDDDPDFLDLLIDQIGRIPQVQITAAHNPQQALERLGQKNYRLVVSDWALDTWTGGDVIRTADGRRKGRPAELAPPSSKVPVLFISGSEKVNETRTLRSLNHFEPVSFVLKRCGATMISRVAEQILEQFPIITEEVPC